MAQIYFLFGALCALLSVVAGAFAAHALHDRIDPALLAAFQTGAQYQMYHAFALILVGSIMRIDHTDRWLYWSGACFAGGIILFSGSLYAMALTGIRIFGMLTPLGGLLFIAGWIALMVAGLRWRER